MTVSTTAPAEFRKLLGPGGLEARAIATDVVARADDGEGAGKVIAGYGSVFEQSTTIGRYYQFDEVVAAGAWTESIKTGDIRCMKNHDTNWLLGRTKSGSLRLSEDDTGLAYEVDINEDDANAVSTWAQVDREDIDGSSVWFRVIREEWTEPDDSNDLERPLRRIIEGALYETGPVVFPAFEVTTAATRALGPLDTALRAAGVSDARRARLAVDLTAGSTDVEDELRTLFARTPDLRDAVCGCDRRAADSAPPPGAAGSAPDPDAARRAEALAIARAHLALAGARR